MSQPFALPSSFTQQASFQEAAPVLALLCVELLSSELAFSAPTVDREAVHQAWHQQLVERIKHLGEDLGASVERQSHNIAFIAFAQEPTPVDALESAMKLVLDLQSKPLPIAQQHPSLHL
jgi:hypothetical protein